MSELFKIVLSLSLSGTLLFFIMLALKPLYKNKLSKRWQYYIWLIVVVRMLLPFTPETNLVGSVFEYLGSTNVEAIETSSPANNNQSNFIAEDSYITPNTAAQAPQSSITTASTISFNAIFLKAYKNLWILWAAIALALLIRKVTMYQSFVHFVKAGRTEVSDIEMLNLLADTGEAIGVKRPVELFTNPLISSPMLLGFFRPHIILPSIELEKTELAYILRHELTHYKHMDMFYKWLVQVTVCLHWFNPFAYLLAREINKCCELSCDETIIRIMDMDEKKIYGETLLNSLKVAGNYNDKLATVTLTEGTEQLKERLDAIMKFKKKGNATAAITLILTVMLCIGATAVGAYATPQPQTDTIKVAVNQENNTNQNIITVPIDIKAVKNGTFIWLGEFNLSYGDKMYYDVLAEKGNGLQTGFAAPEDDPLNRTYFTISNKRKDGSLYTKGDFIFAAPVKPGQYNLFIRATDGDLTNVKGSITIEYTVPPTAIPKIPVDLNSSNKSQVSYKEDYDKWDITYIDETYYYKNEPVRIFMDLRADSSFANFSYNKTGSVDLRLVRDAGNSIIAAEYMSESEAEEILSDIEQEQTTNEDIERLTWEEAPDDVRAAISSCDDKGWYVIEAHGRQYIYYNNLPHNYAYEYEPNQSSLKIVDIGTSSGNYVLLSVPIHSDLAIIYNLESVTYKNVPLSNAKENTTTTDQTASSKGTSNDFWEADWNDEWNEFDKAFSNEKGNYVSNTSNVKLINTKQMGVSPFQRYARF